MSNKEFFDRIWSTYGAPAAFVANLSQRMLDSDVSQHALARASGYDPSHINHWLRGRKAPSMHSMVLLDEAMHRLEAGV